MMTPQQIAQTLQDRFGDKIIAAFPDDKHPRVHVNAQDWREIAEFLLREPSLKLDWLANHTGVDYVADEQFCVVHDLWSFDHRHSFAVKVYCPRCSSEKELDSIQLFACPACGELTPEVLEGRELQVVAMEIEEKHAEALIA